MPHGKFPNLLSNPTNSIGELRSGGIIGAGSVLMEMEYMRVVLSWSRGMGDAVQIASVRIGELSVRLGIQTNLTLGCQ